MNKVLTIIRSNPQKYVVSTMCYLGAILLVVLFRWVVQPVEPVKKSALQTTEFLNPTLPEAKLRGDGVGTKLQNMEKSWGQINDYTAVDNIDRDEEELMECYDSKYSQDEIDALEIEEQDIIDQLALEMEQEDELLRQLNKSAQRADEIMNSGEPLRQMPSEEEWLEQMRRQQQQSLEEVNNSLDNIRSKSSNQGGLQTDDDPLDLEPEDLDGGSTQKGAIDTNQMPVMEMDDDPSSILKAVKVAPPRNAHFNTIRNPHRRSNMIKAIIDEDISAVEGSRVRLRLLDDIDIDGVRVEKGTYLYATMSGFGSQRVKGVVKSVMTSQDILPISLNIYDTDGLEGLYIPQSSFRETGKDIASSAMNNNVNISSSGYANTFEQWGIQAAQNAISKTTGAISKAIKKNRAKLKYGTQVYLVNGRGVQR